jgi:NAD(P)-dependent dehydrogenase (short-subunit alcohol dehydrogenase family)
LGHYPCVGAGELGVTVNALAPGFTLTEASLSLMDDAASDFITGQTLIVDGGRQFL